MRLDRKNNRLPIRTVFQKQFSCPVGHTAVIDRDGWNSGYVRKIRDGAVITDHFRPVFSSRHCCACGDGVTAALRELCDLGLVTSETTALRRLSDKLVRRV